MMEAEAFSIQDFIAEGGIVFVQIEKSFNITLECFLNGFADEAGAVLLLGPGLDGIGLPITGGLAELAKK